MQLCDPDNTCQWLLYLAGLEIMEAGCDSWNWLNNAVTCIIYIELSLSNIRMSLMIFDELFGPKNQTEIQSLHSDIKTSAVKRTTVAVRQISTVSVGVWISYLWSGWRHLCKAYWGCGLLSSGNWPVEVESRRQVRMKVSSIRNDEQWSESQTSRWRNSSTQEHRAGDGRPSVHLKQRTREKEPGHLEEQRDERQAEVSSIRTHCTDFMVCTELTLVRY